MILKSFLVEKNINLLQEYFAVLIYGENIGLKDDIKIQIKKQFQDYEQITFNQDDIIKNNKLLDEQVGNNSLFSKKKIIFINEVSDRIENYITETLQNSREDVKIFLFSQNLDKKSMLRKIFEKEKKTAIIPCYQDNERTLSEYVRKKLEGYTGLNQQMINFIINNSGLDRKTLFNEINKIKCFFLDKKIEFTKLPELLNNNNNLDFNDVRDSCLGCKKKELNANLGNVIFQNENAIFYLSVLGSRIEKLLKLCEQFEKDRNLEKVIDSIKPPIFWKDKPIFYKQMSVWNRRKLEEAQKMLFETEFLVKTNLNSNNNTLIKNLIVNLCKKGMATS